MEMEKIVESIYFYIKCAIKINFTQFFYMCL